MAIGDSGILMCAVGSTCCGWGIQERQVAYAACSGNNRMMARLVKDLPEPDSPTKPKVFPGFNTKSIWFKISRY